MRTEERRKNERDRGEDRRRERENERRMEERTEGRAEEGEGMGGEEGEGMGRGEKGRMIGDRGVGRRKVRGDMRGNKDQYKCNRGGLVGFSSSG